MGRSVKQYTRGASAYEMRSLGGKLGARLSVTVVNAFADLAPALVAMKNGGIGSLDVSKLKLDWDKVEPLLDAFAAHTFLLAGAKREPLSPEVFDEHFAGDLDGMLELLLQGVELNYASFLEQRFGVSIAAMKELWKKLSEQSASESPTESTGTSGE